MSANLEFDPVVTAEGAAVPAAVDTETKQQFDLGREFMQKYREAFSELAAGT